MCGVGNASVLMILLSLTFFPYLFAILSVIQYTICCWFHVEMDDVHLIADCVTPKIDFFGGHFATPSSRKRNDQFPAYPWPDHIKGLNE